MHCSLGGVEASTILINFNSFFYIVNVYSDLKLKKIVKHQAVTQQKRSCYFITEKLKLH